MDERPVGPAPQRGPRLDSGRYTGPYSYQPPLLRAGSAAVDVRRTEPRDTWHVPSLAGAVAGAAAAFAGLAFFVMIFPRGVPYGSYGSYATGVYVVLFAVAAGAMGVRYWCLARPVVPRPFPEADGLAITASFTTAAVLMLQVVVLFMVLGGGGYFPLSFAMFGIPFLANLVGVGLALSETADLALMRPRAGTRRALDSMGAIYMLIAWIAVMTLYGRWESGY